MFAFPLPKIAFSIASLGAKSESQSTVPGITEKLGKPANHDFSRAALHKPYSETQRASKRKKGHVASQKLSVRAGTEW